MPQDQTSKKFELVDREVCCERRLLAFFSDDTDTNVSLLDHANIVAAISNAASSLASELCNFLSYQTLLSWTAPAYADARSLGSCRPELLLEVRT